MLGSFQLGQLGPDELMDEPLPSDRLARFHSGSCAINGVNSPRRALAAHLLPSC